MLVKIHLRAGQSKVGGKQPVVNFTDSMGMKKLVQDPAPISTPTALAEKQGL